MKKQIIISGGGIAGLTAALLLHRQGHEVTVVDRAKEFTRAGFLLSLKNFGVGIMEALGLAGQLREAATPSEFMDFVEAGGSLIRHISYEKMSEHMERSITITRGDLHHVLYDAVKNDVCMLLDTAIEDVRHDGQRVSVTLSDGQVLSADLLIVSEGLRSATRGKYFAQARLEDFNVFYMGGRLKTAHAYRVGHFKTFIDVGKMLSVYPISQDELAIQSYIYSTEEAADAQHNAQQLLRESFAAYPPDVRELLARFLDNGLLFADKMGMVQAPDLASGSLVLLGDAGYCPTALSGMGASLSIYGAKALAHFMGQSPDDLPQALRSYNSLMQPMIRKFQGNARNNAASFLPKDEQTLRQFVTAFRSASETDAHRRLTNQIILTEDQLRFALN